MSRKKLINQLKNKNPELNKLELETIINVFSKSIIDALTDHRDVEIRGLGRLYCRKLKANYNARNPATNELIYKSERYVVRFKLSKKINRLINK